MKIALAQINPIVGDLKGNCRKILEAARAAERQGAELAAFPEHCVAGYPPLDLLENARFIEAVEQALAGLARALPPSLGVVVGAPLPNRSGAGKRLYNAARLLHAGETVATVHKMLLPTYDVFDESRYFEPAHASAPVAWNGLRLGLHICEDMWNSEAPSAEAPPTAAPLYACDPIEQLAGGGVDVFLNISASPFSTGKTARRRAIIAGICRRYDAPFLFVNQVGANTELIFDGASGVFGADGRCLVSARSFEEDLILWDSEAPPPPDACPPREDETADLHDALVLGIRDYAAKTGAFTKALVGLSGGIDSAVTCALAAAALGPERVVGVTMPSRYSSAGSVEDSRLLAEALGITFHQVPILPAVEAFTQMLAPIFGGAAPGVAEENIQARSRGVTLMALSNKYDYLLLSTGNKSEMATGYATLYGDMNGGLAVLSDVYKMQVYALAEHVNRLAGRDVIPRSTLTKPPSAELRPDQTDQDSLPPYPVLDAILHAYIERQMEADAIAEATGYARRLVLEVLRMVDRNEYKRRQAPPGLRVSDKAFGMGRRLPIVMRWDRTALPHLHPDAALTR